MARQIDERIVQMTFDNRNFEKNAKSTIGVLDKLKSSLNFSGATKGLDDLNTSASKVNLSGLYDATLKVSNGFNAMEQIAIGSLRRIGEMITDTGIKLLKSMTVDPVKISWAKYDESIASEQAIMSAVEGKSDAEGNAYDMEAVVERVERLKWFADETSYSITQMTNALGQFTASGQDLDKSVTAVMGIANACADAGVSTQKAESAFIGFAKAIGSGTLTLGTWNMQLKTSGITNSERFRKTLLESAVAMGTLTKESDKYYHKGIEITTANFTEYLNKGIITSDVLIESLNRYADTTLTVREVATGNIEAISDLYKTADKEMSAEMSAWVKDVEENGTTASQAIKGISKAYEELGIEVPQSLKALRRAQEAISFTQAIEATAEAVTSQFSNIYHLMFGNYEEAKKLWSSMADALNEWFVGPLYDLVDVFALVKNSWNNMEWNDSSEKPATQLLAIWEELATAINHIKDAFHDLWVEVFDVPEMEDAAKSIFDFIEGIRNSLKTFNEFMADPWRNRENGWDALFQTLMMIFQVIKFIKNVLDTIFKSFITPLSNKFKPILGDIFVIIQNIANIFQSKFFDAGKNLGPLEKILKGILDVLDPFISGLSSVVKWFRELTEQWKNSELDKTTEKFSLFGSVCKFIGNILETIGKIFKGTSTIFKDLGASLSTVFDNLKGSISNFLSSNGTDVANIAEAGFLGYIILGLTQFTKKLKGLSLETVMDKIKGSFKSLGFIDSIKETFNTLTESIKTFTESIKVKMLDQISTALIKLAAAVLIISLIDSNKLVSSLGAIAGLLVEVITAMALVNSIDGKGLRGSTKAFSKIASGLLVLSVALKILSTIDPNQMLVALSGMGAVLLGLGLFLAAVSKSIKNMKGSDIKSLGSFMKSIGKAMIEMSIALKVMATINIGDMGVAILGLVGVLASIGLFIIAVDKLTSGMDSKKMTILGSFMKSVGFAMIELAAALKILSTIKIEELGPALLGLVGLLSIVAIFVAAMNAVGGGGLALAGSAAGLILMSAALLALSGVLKILSTIGWDVIGDGLLKMSAVMLSFGVIGAILGVISPLFLLFSASLLTFGLALKVIVSALTEAIPLFIFFQAAGEDFVTTLIGIFTKTFSNLLLLLPQFIVQLISTIISTLSQIKDLIIQVLDLIIQIIIEGLPKLIELGTSIIIALLTGIKDNIYQVTTIVMDIITQFLSAMTEKLPELIDGLLKFLTAAINGVAEGIRGNAGEIGAAIGNLMSALLEGLVDFAWSAVSTFGKNIWDAITSPFTGKEKEAKDSGKNVMDDVKQGMEEKEPELKQKAEEIGTTTAESMEDTERATQSGQNMISGLLSGLSDTSALYEKGKQAARAYMDGFDSEGVIRSPSKEMIKRGKYMIEGLVIGLKQMSELEQVSKGAGSMILDAISNAIQLADQILDDGMNPVITPVLDLSNIEENAGGISSLLNSNSSLYSAQNINSLLSSLDRRNNRLVKEDQFGIQNGGENGVTFVQNNYSPKSLSSIEIYRQTKNQISVMKGLVNSR